MAQFTVVISKTTTYEIRVDAATFDEAVQAGAAADLTELTPTENKNVVAYETAQ